MDRKIYMWQQRHHTMAGDCENSGPQEFDISGPRTAHGWRWREFTPWISILNFESSPWKEIGKRNGTKAHIDTTYDTINTSPKPGESKMRKTHCRIDGIIGITPPPPETGQKMNGMNSQMDRRQNWQVEEMPILWMNQLCVKTRSPPPYVSAEAKETPDGKTYAAFVISDQAGYGTHPTDFRIWPNETAKAKQLVRSIVLEPCFKKNPGDENFSFGPCRNQVSKYQENRFFTHEWTLLERKLLNSYPVTLFAPTVQPHPTKWSLLIVQFQLAIPTCFVLSQCHPEQAP